MFEVSSKQLKEWGGKCNVVHARSSSKQLAMFLQTARYISMIVSIPCLWITHHIPRLKVRKPQLDYSAGEKLLSEAHS